MMIGVSCETFWHGDYTKLKYYIDAYDLERQKKSEEMWMQGLYVLRAFSSVISNAFGGKGKKVEYPKEPIRVIPYTEEEKRQIKQQEEEKVLKQFQSMMDTWDRSHKKD